LPASEQRGGRSGCGVLPIVRKAVRLGVEVTRWHKETITPA